MMGERRVMQEALLYGFSLSGTSPTIICCARSTGSPVRRSFWAKGPSGALYSDVGVLRSIQT